MREEITLITLELSDPRLALVSVTDVDVSSDLRHAHVFVSHLGDEEEIEGVLKALRHAASHIRRELAARGTLRYVPELSFHWDSSVDQGQRIEELLRQIGFE
jgi:ribosome-binding factor A